MSFYDINDALFGTGEYGSARYGIVSPNVSITGVSATGAIQAPSIGGLEVDISEVLTSVSATSSLGTIVPSVSDSVTLTGVVAINSTNPEFGLTLDGSLPEGSVDGSFVTRTANIVFAGQLTLPSSFTQTVPFWEHGGAGVGAWFGVSKISNVYNLRVRAGEGSTSVNLLSDDTDVVIANVPISQIPEFDGNTHTVTWELRPQHDNGGRIRLWIDGRLVINQGTSGGANLEGNSWSGGNTGGWGIGKSSIAGGTTDSGGTQYQAPAERTWSGTIQSDLRYYHTELVTDLTPLVQVNIQEDITGVSATGSINSVVISRVVTIVGVAGTLALGSIEPQVTEDITGVSATGGIGTFTVANTVGPTGIVGTTNSPALQVNIQEDIVGTSATSAVGSVTTATAAGLTGVSATGAISGLSVGQFEIDVSEVIPTGVSATGAVQQIIPSSVVGLTGVSATSAVSSLATGQFEVDVSEVLTAVVATGTAGSLGAGVSVTPTGILGTSGLTAVSVNIKKVPTGVVGTSSAGALQLNPTAGLDGVEATGTAGSILVGTSENIESVLATSSIGTISINVKKLLTSILGTSALGSITSTGVIFDFDTVKDLYGRKRIVYVEGFTEQSKERRIYVPNENRTVSVEKVGLNRRTIFIPQENRKVYIQPYSTSAERRVRAA